MSIRLRLILSFAVVLGVTLVVVAGALVLFLSAQPRPRVDAYRELSDLFSTLLDEQSLRRGSISARLLRAQWETRQVELSAFAAENDARVLALNLANTPPTIWYDSSGALAPGTTLAVRPDTAALPRFFQRRLPVGAESLIGTFEDPGGAWLFVGIAFTRLGQESAALVIARPPQPPSLADTVTDFRETLARPLIQAGLVGLLIALLLAVAISRGLVNSLQSLAEAAVQVARGNYAWKVKAAGPPEVRSVAEAFNHMSGQVQATQQAEQDFLANVSHDLKTPLTSIQGYSQAIMDGAAKDPAGAARIIHEEAARLNRLVVQLTDLAALQSGQFSFRMQPLDLPALAGAVVERLSIVARKKDVNLHLEAGAVPTVPGDGDRLAQVLTNLVGNAIHYTPAGGQVWLRLRAAGGGVEVSVEDTGVGLSKDELQRVFERFYRADKARQSGRGSGLGLAIATEIAAAHAGRLTAASEGPGRGSTFTLWLPVRPQREHLTNI